LTLRRGRSAAAGSRKDQKDDQRQESSRPPLWPSFLAHGPVLHGSKIAQLAAPVKSRRKQLFSGAAAGAELGRKAALQQGWLPCPWAGAADRRYPTSGEWRSRAGGGSGAPSARPGSPNPGRFRRRPEELAICRERWRPQRRHSDHSYLIQGGSRGIIWPRQMGEPSLSGESCLEELPDSQRQVLSRPRSTWVDQGVGKVAPRNQKWGQAGESRVLTTTATEKIPARAQRG